MQCTLVEHLSGLNTDILKSWLRRVNALEKGMTRKDDFIRSIGQQLTLNLAGILNQMTPDERCWLAECAHQKRFVQSLEFQAKHEMACPVPSMTVSHNHGLCSQYCRNWRRGSAPVVPSARLFCWNGRMTNWLSF